MVQSEGRGFGFEDVGLAIECPLCSLCSMWLKNFWHRGKGEALGWRMQVLATPYLRS